jgi:hypothetical protein
MVCMKGSEWGYMRTVSLESASKPDGMFPALLSLFSGLLRAKCWMLSQPVSPKREYTQ